jgi:signal peptidase I
MRRKTRTRRTALGILAATALALAVGLGVAAAAPGVVPSSVTATLNPGDHITVAKVVHTQAIPPKPDIYLLSDSTGSMGDAIANVQANAGAIMSTVNGSTTGAMFGAGDYKDFQRPQLDPYVFQKGASIGTAAAATVAINAWTAPAG